MNRRKERNLREGELEEEKERDEKEVTYFHNPTGDTSMG